VGNDSCIALVPYHRTIGGFYTNIAAPLVYKARDKNGHIVGSGYLLTKGEWKIFEGTNSAADFFLGLGVFFTGIFINFPVDWETDLPETITIQ